MKYIYLFLLIFISTAVKAQNFIGSGANVSDTTSERYVNNSPTNSQNNRRVVEKMRDSLYIKWFFNNIYFNILTPSLNDGAPTNFLWYGSNGRLQGSPLSALAINQNNVIGLPDSLLNHFTKAQADVRYMLNTDTVPLGKIMTKTTADAAGAALQTSINTKATTFTLTTTGTSGAATYSGNVINIPVYANSGGTVTSVSTSSPLTGGTITGTGTIGITQVTTSTNGYLSSTDWNTFNGKQTALNGTGFVKATGTTISYDNSTYLTGNQTITLSGDIIGSGATAIATTLANSGITAGTYMSATFDAKGRATSGINPTIDTLSSARTFNTAYRMSTTQYVEVKPNARIACNLSLTGGQEGYVTLQISPNGSAPWTSVGQIYNSNTGTLTIGLNTTQINGSQLSILLPPNYYWQMATTNITGSPTYTMQQGGKLSY